LISGETYFVPPDNPARYAIQLMFPGPDRSESPVQIEPHAIQNSGWLAKTGWTVESNPQLLCWKHQAQCRDA